MRFWNLSSIPLRDNWCEFFALFGYLPRQLGYKSVTYINCLTITDSLKRFGKGVTSAEPEGGYPGTPEFDGEGVQRLTDQRVAIAMFRGCQTLAVRVFF